MANNMPDIALESVASTDSRQMNSGKTGLLATGGLLAALGVGSCCVLPVALMSVGLGGAWLSNLYALSSYQPVFIVLSLGFLGTGFYYVYRKPKSACDTDALCDTPRSNRFVKDMLWCALVLVLAGLAFPYVGQYLLQI